jgi:cytoskeletal protein CcmA (bactofilin family)
MWNRKKDEEPMPRVTAPPTATSLAREGIPMQTLPPPRAAEPELSRAASIGKSVVIKGQVFSREDLYVDGEVEGTIEMPESRLTVGPNGRVLSMVKAREVVVVGTIHGNVEVGDKIDIRKDAKLLGDIRTARVVIEDGAYFKGSIDIVRPEPKPQPAPRPAPPAQAAVATAGAGGAAASSASTATLNIEPNKR